MIKASKEMDATFKETQREKGRVSSNHETTYFWHTFYPIAFHRNRTPARKRHRKCTGAQRHHSSASCLCIIPGADVPTQTDDRQTGDVSCQLKKRIEAKFAF
jgi:hypothetical protein